MVVVVIRPVGRPMTEPTFPEVSQVHRHSAYVDHSTLDHDHGACSDHAHWAGGVHAAGTVLEVSTPENDPLGYGREARFKTYKVKSTATVRAVRYLGTTPGHNADALAQSHIGVDVRHDGLYIWVQASEAWCRLGLGSYVIEEPNHPGWFYPCTDKEFWAKYE